MEVCGTAENSNVSVSCNDRSSSLCSSINVTSERSNCIEYMVDDCLNERERSDQVPEDDTDVCPRTCEVPSSPGERSEHSVRQSIQQNCSSGNNDKAVSLVFPCNMKTNLLHKDTSLHDNREEISSGFCEGSDSHSDFLSAVSGGAEKVLVELTESCDLSSIGHGATAAIESEKVTLSKSDDYCKDTSSIHSPDRNELDSLSEETIIKEETEEEINYIYGKVCDITSSQTDEHETQFYTDSVKNESCEFSALDYSGELHSGAASNDDSDTISADEKVSEIDSPESTLPETFATGKCSHHDLSVGISGTSSIIKKDKLESCFSGQVLYRCIKCNFTDKTLEQLSLHVLTCAKKRKYGRNQAYRIDGEVPTKARFLSNDQKPQFTSTIKTQSLNSQTQTVIKSQTQTVMLSQTQAPEKSRIQSLVWTRTHAPVTSQSQPVLSQTNASQLQSLVLAQNQVPITSKSQFIFAPQRQLLTSSQTKLAATPNTLHSTPTTRFVIAPSSQLPGTSKTVFAITTKSPFTSTSKPQLVISPRTQLAGTSKPQLAVATSRLSTPSRTQINTSALANNSSMQNMRPVISLPTQLPIPASNQFSSLSKPQVTTSRQNQLSIPPGAKITIGPQTQIPVVPQAPLALSPQGNLTISQAGSQLLITTKPVQQNAGAPNQPTLLGLGIGTNPTVVPKNIVLLPNLLLNSGPSSAGNLNGKQAPASIQGQYIFQSATKPQSSGAPMQLQQNIVYTPHSIAKQSSVLLSSAYTVPNKPLSSVSTSPLNVVQQSKLSLLVSSPTQPTSTAPASTTLKLNEQSRQPQQLSNQATFICEICDDYVKDLEKLRSHMQCLHEINIHPKMMPSFNCQKCQFCFFTEQGLERHLLGSHGLVTTGMQDAADKGKDSGRCPVCGWGYQSKLLDHVATDHKVSLKPADLSYKCTLCTATFGVYKQFEDHVYSAHRPVISKLAQGNSQSSSQAIK